MIPEVVAMILPAKLTRKVTCAALVLLASCVETPPEPASTVPSVARSVQLADRLSSGGW
jgi:hypothetical protein